MSKYKITINGKEYEMDVELMDGSAPAAKAPAEASIANIPVATRNPVSFRFIEYHPPALYLHVTEKILC